MFYSNSSRICPVTDVHLIKYSIDIIDVFVTKFCELGESDEYA